APECRHPGGGTSQLEIAREHPAEGRLGVGAELERIARAVDTAGLDEHVCSGFFRRPLEAYAVVLGVDEAVPDDDASATVDVEAVVVEVGLILHVDAFDEEVL